MQESPVTSWAPGLPNNVALTPLSFLHRAARVFPEREAIRADDRRWNYRELANETQAVARAIAARIDAGDRVAYLAPNVPELLVAHFAVPLAGGVLVTINTRLVAGEVRYILEHSGAKLLFVDEELLDTALAAVDGLADVEVVVVGENGAPERAPEGAQLAGYRELVDRNRDGDPLPWTVEDENALIAINYTSGTTGKPKGVMYSHRGAYLNALGFVHHAGFTGSTRYLWTLPMFHCNGWCTTWAVTATAGLHICIRAVREAEVWRALDTDGISHLCGAPAVLTTIANAPQAHPVDRPLSIITGGAPPSPTIIARLESLGITVVHAYGLTEVYGPFTSCEYQDAWDSLEPGTRAERMARQGVAMLQAGAVRVVDTDLNDVPADGTTIGEIVMRGNNVMLGYFRDEAATVAAFRGGWFHSGDLGVLHADGYIEVKDRDKDMIISGGENISSIEIENALVTHPAVLDAAVVAVPSEKWGERPHAHVVLVAGQSATVDELRLHVRGLIAAYKVPDGISFLDELPRTSTGKVLKRELRA